MPTLVASFLHFDVSFMLWVLLGALGVYIGASLGLSPSQKALMVAIPILSGSLLRVALGLLSDRLGGKRIGAAMLGFLFLPLFLGWQAGNSLPAMLAIGLLLGTAGASFAVALPLASRWYPAERQGLVMGIAAAGNSGTVLANLLAPHLASVFGWHNVLALAMLPLAAVLAYFLLAAKDAPKDKRAGTTVSLGKTLRTGDLWWICLLYSVTFGGYVGLSSFLPVFLSDQYGLNPVTAGYLTAVAAVIGSGARPVGGLLADRFGGVRLLSLLLAAIGVMYGAASLLLPIGSFMGLLILVMVCMGLGNGAVFQVVPQRFSEQIGAATGIIGAVGGIGGFLLPNVLGNAKEFGGSYGLGFLLLAALAIGALVSLRILIEARDGWRASWKAPSKPRPVLMVPYWDRS